ncbi:MAG TPA: RNA 2',3'-cyclic phosphodiesterase [Rhodanobacteraceae bacterium]|nr:RNA 2',3'-cyclic phosphodiesterase [Rhodanobacteraceae bacterium]
MTAPAASDVPDTARCFLALLPDAASRETLSALRETHAGTAANARGLRWVDASSLHLTLRFLGDTTTAQAEYLKHMLPTLACDLPKIPSRRCAIWPNRARPRVLVLELDAPAELQTLAQASEALARKCGFEPDSRAFKAHLTLARLRPGCALGSSGVPPVQLTFDTLALMASDLRATGARYRSLARIPLPVPA